MQITNKVFNDLALWMIGLGLLMGVVFPFFLLLAGVSSDLVFKPWFFVACMTAGFIVGVANISLAKGVVERRIDHLVQRMRVVENNIKEWPAELILRDVPLKPVILRLIQMTLLVKARGRLTVWLKP